MLTYLKTINQTENKSQGITKHIAKLNEKIPIRFSINLLFVVGAKNNS